tara:strand:- start:1035 stop:1331 length:297 start_codon:yes stop_codon:yes gene_type:complete
MKSVDVSVGNTIRIHCSFAKALEFCKTYNLEPDVRKLYARVDGDEKYEVYNFIHLVLVENLADVYVFISFTEEDKWQSHWKYKIDEMSSAEEKQVVDN